MTSQKRILSPAKINLTLSILGRDEAGYHELQSLVCLVNLYDEIHIDPSEKTEVVFTGSFANNIDPHHNSVTKTFEALNYFPKSKITVIKNIPSGAGLGGGSSNAAALISYYGDQLNLDVPQMIEASIKVGSDVALFLSHPPLYMGGRGEKILARCKLPDFYLLLAVPKNQTSTKAVYEACNGAKGEGTEIRKDFEDFDDFVSFLQKSPNDLTQPAMRVTPCISSVLKSLSGLKDAKLARLTGSGSGCFALFETKAQAEKAMEDIKHASQDLSFLSVLNPLASSPLGTHFSQAA